MAERRDRTGARGGHALAASAAPLSVDDITARFKARGPWKRRVSALLDMLVALGRAREHDGRYSGA